MEEKRKKGERETDPNSRKPGMEIEINEVTEKGEKEVSNRFIEMKV